MFLSFANFYKKFIKNFNRIAALFTLILLTISNNNLSTLINNNEKNQGILCNISNKDINKDIKNLSSIVKLAKSKKLKTNFSETEFLTLKVKKAFIYL